MSFSSNFSSFSLTSLRLGYSQFSNVSFSSYFLFFFRLLSVAAICVALFFCRSALSITHVPFSSLCRHCHCQPIGNILILLLLKFKPQFGSQTDRQRDRRAAIVVASGKQFAHNLRLKPLTDHGLIAWWHVAWARQVAGCWRQQQLQSLMVVSDFISAFWSQFVCISLCVCVCLTVRVCKYNEWLFRMFALAEILLVAKLRALQQHAARSMQQQQRMLRQLIALATRQQF